MVRGDTDLDYLILEHDCLKYIPAYYFLNHGAKQQQAMTKAAEHNFFFLTKTTQTFIISIGLKYFLNLSVMTK